MSEHDDEHLLGHTALDPSGAKIGPVVAVYGDDEGGQSEWLAVDTGLIRTKASLAPLAGAEVRGDDVVLAVSKGTVKTAPTAGPDGPASDADEAQALAHYADANADANADEDRRR